MSKPAPDGAPHDPAALSLDRGENRGYRPISDYGIIGDMHTAALIAADGSIDWACLPYFDSPAVFLRLLDRQRGGYCSVPVTDLVSTSRRYREGTNILATTFTTTSGSFELNDFMPMRSPGDGREPCGRIVRLARCTAGHVDFAFHFRPPSPSPEKNRESKRRRLVQLFLKGAIWCFSSRRPIS